MIHSVTLFYAALCAVTLGLAMCAPRAERVDAVLAATVLAAGCLASNIAWIVASIGSWKRIDAAVMLLLLWLLWRSRRRWKIVLASLAVVTMGVHAIAEWAGDLSEGMMYAYPAALNAIFVLELLCVASIGAKGAKDHGSGWLVFTRPRRAGDHLDRRRRSSDE